MNKLFATLFLFIASLNLQAQDEYVKFLKDVEIQGKKFFKGEIYPLTTSSDVKFPFHFSVGTETFGVGKSVEKLQTNPEDKTSLKDDFVKSKEDGWIHIDVSSVSSGSDTIRLVSEKFDVTPIVKNTTFDLEEAKIGKSFRLIIPNSPTLYYSLNDLKTFDDPNKDIDADGVIDREDKCPKEKGTSENQGCPQKEEVKESGWALWQIILLSVIGIGIVGIGGLWFIKKRKNDDLEEVYITFNGNSLKEFALDNGISLAELMKYNKNVIDNKYDKYDDRDRKQVQKDLNGKKLMVGYQPKGSSQNNNQYPTNEFPKKPQQESPKELESPKGKAVQPTNFGNNNELSGQLREMQSTLIREIQKISSGNNNQNEINRLQNVIAEVENKLRVLETDKRNLDAKLIQMQSDNATAVNNLQTAMTETIRFQNEIKELKERVIAVEFLKGYSESVFTYLKYCQQVSCDAYNFFNKISQQNPKQAFAAGHLLMKFQSAVNSIPVGDWLRTVQDIKDSGATTNRQLTRSFSQIQNDGEKQKEFQRLLFSEVLTKYSSNILILAEAFKNLSRFQGSADFVNEAQSTFGKHVTEIISKAKSTGLDIKHVPLFESWEKYLGQVEDNGGERSLAYKEITGLGKGAIAEIVSYGVKTSIGDDTKTIIILA